MINPGSVARPEGHVEVERVGGGEVISGDLNNEINSGGDGARGSPVGEDEEDGPDQGDSGLPSYLQAVAAREDGAWLNLGYLP